MITQGDRVGGWELEMMRMTKYPDIFLLLILDLLLTPLVLAPSGTTGQEAEVGHCNDQMQSTELGREWLTTSTDGLNSKLDKT